MLNILKKLFILSSLSVVIYGAVKVSETTLNESNVQSNNYEYIESALLSSSRYTKPDDLSLVDPEFYVDIKSSDDLIAENDTYQLYFDEDVINFKVLNKDTGYVWSAAIEDADAGTYSGLLSSGVGIEYILPEKDMFIEENVGISDTVFSCDQELINNGIKLSLNVGGYCSTRRCKNNYDNYLEGEYTLEEMIDWGFDQIGVSFDMIVELSDEGVSVKIPYESISEERPEELTLSSFIVFPGMGGTYMADIPGYMVVPDGSGALIRYEDNQGQYNAPFEEYYFGRNYGLSTTNSSVVNYDLALPIFGAVHGVNQNAFVGIIESGMFNARLMAYPNGANNIDYNVIFPKFDIKQVYRQSFSSDGTGGGLQYLNTSTADIQLKYEFLENDDANYVGIAKAYRDYLTDLGDLQKQNQNGDIDIFLQYLMSDNENSFLGSSLIEMSTVAEVKEMYDYFMENGLVNQMVALMGWNNGGYSGELPAKLNFENKLGSNRSFRSLIEYINSANSILLVNDYVFASEDSNRISYRLDVAKGSNRFKMGYTQEDRVHSDTYVLYPAVTRQLALKDYQDYLDENVGILMSSLASVLFSYYDSGNFNREDAYLEYLQVLETYSGIASYYYPYAYAFKYTNNFFDTPLYNSQMKYYDDVVPLLQIVLKGSIDMYASYLNYNALGQDTLLNLVDYGINPAYILTYKPSSLLRNSDIARYYTTEFDLWKTTIVEEYNYINEALKYVNGEYIESRVVLDYGVVRISYSNGVDIYVNYSSHDFSNGLITVKAYDYYVGGVS